MSVSVEKSIIRLHGSCGAEDIEPLISALEKTGPKQVDFADVEHLHGAVLQTLLAYGPAISGTPRDSFVRTWLIPILEEAHRTNQPANASRSQPPENECRSIE
jgi:hypothetical protein